MKARVAVARPNMYCYWGTYHIALRWAVIAIRGDILQISKKRMEYAFKN